MKNNSVLADSHRQLGAADYPGTIRTRLDHH